MHFLYLQDDFRVNNKLTLNMGVRYEYATPRWEKDNILSNYDPSTNTLIQAKDGSLFDRTLVNSDRNNFAPRLGLAYSVTPKTVIRGGYGISYVHQNRVGSADLLGINGPQVVIATVNQSNPTDPTFSRVTHLA
jgi:outer membrane receptor protein involved in Fe transport